jgi:putative transposase
LRYFNSSRDIIRLAVMMYVRYPLSLRQVEDLLFEGGIDNSHETVRFWWNRFGPVFTAEIRKRRVDRRFYSKWRWHLASIHASVHNLFNLQRHLNNREIFKRNRTAALDEWCQLAA